MSEMTPGKFDSFKVERYIGTKQVEEEELVFESKLGNFKYYQERILVFFRSKEFLAFVGLIVIQALLSLTLLDFSDLDVLRDTLDEYIIPVTKGIVIAILAYAFIVPVSLVWIRKASMDKNLPSLCKALDLAILYNKIGRVFVIITAVLSVIIVIMTLLVSFFLALFFGVLLALILYFSYLFITRLIEFLEACRYNALPNATKEKKTQPDAESLKAFLYISLALSTINFFLSLFGFVTGEVTGIDIFSGLLSLGIQGYTIYLVEVFNSTMRRVRPRKAPKVVLE